ncbi:nickel-dependent hydrogenase large subunit [Leptothrix sp. BB-4]
MSSPDVFGQLRLRPGVPMPDGIVGGRADVTERLLRGQTPAAAIDRVALLHTLCAMAHRQVARRAVMLALTGQDASPDATTLDALAADIAREHARRIGHDWPRAWGAASQAKALAGLPRAADARALGDWLTTAWLGMSPALWLQDTTRADDTIDIHAALAALHRSAQACPEGIAAALAQAVQRGLALPFSPGPAPSPLRLDDPAQARALGDAMNTPGFCRAPSWDGGVPDTGPWNRLERPLKTTSAGLAERLLSRWIELLRLALPVETGGWRPAHGAVSLGDGQALAWVETSRGLLAHRVSLEGHGDHARVGGWQVLAPTEWNFYPRGTLAHALGAWPADHPDTPGGVRLLACAYDPCMACEIEMPTVESAHHA